MTELNKDTDLISYSNILFYLVFAGQIALLSMYIPWRISSRMRKMLSAYPAADYPKLYPLPERRYYTGEVVYRWINHSIAGIGVALLLGLIFAVDHLAFTDAGFISEAWPAAYAGLQLLPIIALELGGLSQYRKMRAASSRRRATLQPRRLSGLVRPWLLLLAVASFALAVYLDYYANNGVLEWDKALAFAAGNTFMVAVAAWSVFGRKQDPHQSATDRARAHSAVLHSMVYVSIVMSLFYMSTALDQILDLDSLDAIMMSLYFQAVGWLSIGTMLRNIRLHDIDFDVYRAEGGFR